MSHEQTFSRYMQDLASTAKRGDAREESFYPALATMLRETAQLSGRNDVHVTTLPRPTEGGNPDFRLWNGTDRIIGYIEAKKPTEDRLDLIERSDQLRRYRDTFPNLILTNFLEFRLYRNGDHVRTVLAGRPLVLNDLLRAPPLEKSDDLQALLSCFLQFSLPQAFTAESLAKELATRTRFLRDVLIEQLRHERDTQNTLSGFYKAFQTYLIGTLTPEEFADLFAQTVAYGLFAARTRSNGDFSRRAAFHNIPHTIGVLRDLFRFISLEDLPEAIAWCVDDLAEVLAVADAAGILERYYRNGKGSDPIVHFYETFLAQYDPGERERRGVYYTPEPVVDYIVRSLHGLLKTKFGKKDGLASEGVNLLDPAAGTMTFVAHAARQAVAEFEVKYGGGGREDFIRKHILKNFYALELMMAPYAVGHLKMSFFLEELGHRLEDSERIPFYLTNTLDREELKHSQLPGLSALAEESRLAGAVKSQTPILLILGNPPYSGHSSNKGPWIQELIEDYKRVDGQPLGEKNTKWLQNDYVKFLRFAQWKIDQAGRGIVGMITDNSYLDSRTFRGMRRNLMQTFDETYILDLHGNSNKREVCPDGSPDINVFDIQQGVAIAFFLKHGGKSTNADGKVYRADLYGRRRDKYEWLKSSDHKSTEWTELDPCLPLYMFQQRNEALAAEYNHFTPISDIFEVSSVGIVTARDRLTIRWSEQEVWDTVRAFSGMDPELARQAYKLGKDARDWQVAMAQEDLVESGPTRAKIVPVLYRPFDMRYTYYTGRSRGFICMPRPGVMRHMLAGDNLALVLPKQQKDEFGVLATKFVSGHKLVAAYDINYVFPLYCFPAAKADPKPGNPPVSQPAPDRRSNVSRELVAALTRAHNQTRSSAEIFHYIYAVLHAPFYRENYAASLQTDFPRIPFTTDRELFSQIAGLGKRLTDLHLLRSAELDPPACRFEGQGDARIARNKAQGYRYDRDSRRMYINKTQYFGPVPEGNYEHRIGGYQVCDKWLKDRKDRRLQLDDIRTYCRMVTAIQITLATQREIDKLYPAIEKSLLDTNELMPS